MHASRRTGKLPPRLLAVIAILTLLALTLFFIPVLETDGNDLRAARSSRDQLGHRDPGAGSDPDGPASGSEFSAREPIVTADPQSSVGAGAHQVEIRIQIVGAAREPLEVEDVVGSLIGSLVGGIRRAPFTEEVDRGISRLDVGEARSIEFDRLETDSAIYFPVDRRIELGEKHVIEAGFALSPALVLVVLGADTGLELNEIESVLCTNPVLGGLPRPPGQGNAATTEEGLASPILLEPAAGITARWIRAPGYAWQNVTLDHQATTLRTVALQPSGSLRVSVTGPLPYEATEILVLRDDAGEEDVYLRVDKSHAGEIAGTGGDYPVDSVPVGTYRVELILGTSENYVSLESRPASVRSNQETRVVLGGFGAESPGSLDVLVHLPEQEGAAEATLTLHLMNPKVGRAMRMGRSRLVPDREGGSGPTRQARARFSSLPPGEYALLLMPLRMIHRLTVPEGVAVHETIEVPAPIAVTVKAEDRQAQQEAEAVAAQAFSWFPASARGIPEAMGTPLYLRGEGERQIQCVAGPTVFFVLLADGTATEQEVEITAATREIVLSPRPDRGPVGSTAQEGANGTWRRDLMLMQDGAPVPMAVEWWYRCSLEDLSGASLAPVCDLSTLFASAAVVTLGDSRGGVLILPEIPGYRFDRTLQLMPPAQTPSEPLVVELEPDVH